MKKEVQIGEVVEVNPKIPETLLKQHSGVVSFVPMAGVSEDGVLAFSEEKNLMDVRKGYTYFERGDLLVAKITPCFENGKAVLVNNLAHPVGFGSTEFHVLRPSTDIDAKYLFYFIHNPAFRFIGQLNMTGTAGQKRLPVYFLKTYKIPLPSVSEQKRIAAILDKADAIRRKRRQAIQLADEFLRSVFFDMFGDPVLNPKGWKEARLDQISEIVSGVTKGRKLNGKKTVTVPYMRVANVQDGRILIDDVQEIEVLELEIEKYRLKQGDVLLTEGRDPDKLGRGAVWKGEIDPCIHQNHIFRVRTNKKIILPEFLSALIGSQRGKRYFFKAAKQTTGVASINKTQLSGFPALLPPIDIQFKYLRRLEKIDHMVNLQKNKYKEMGNLFNSLAQRAFIGEL